MWRTCLDDKGLVVDLPKGIPQGSDGWQMEIHFYSLIQWTCDTTASKPDLRTLYQVPQRIKNMQGLLPNAYMN